MDLVMAYNIAHYKFPNADPVQGTSVNKVPRK